MKYKLGSNEPLLVNSSGDANKLKIKENGDTYLVGVGNYDGTNEAQDTTLTLQEAILAGVPGTLAASPSAVTVPTDPLSLAGAITLHKIAWTGAYSDLINPPTIPDDSGLVHKSGSETITGQKTFNGTNTETAHIIFEKTASASPKLKFMDSTGRDRPTFEVESLLDGSTSKMIFGMVPSGVLDQTRLLTLDYSNITAYKSILLTDNDGWPASPTNTSNKPIEISLYRNYSETGDLTTTRYARLRLTDHIDSTYGVTVQGIKTPTSTNSSYDNYAASKKYVDDKVSSVPEYSIALASTSTGAFKSYKLQKGGSDISGSLVIDIPKDFLVKSGSVVNVISHNGHYYESTDTGYTTELDSYGVDSTGKYIKLVVNSYDSSTSTGDTYLYIAAQDLVDQYSGGDGIDIDSSNNVSVSLDSTHSNGLGFDSTSHGLKLDLATQSAAGAMSAADKTKLDTLATVATTGDYNDLINTPSIPDDSGLVHKAVVETITGAKTFEGSASITLSRTSSANPMLIFKDSRGSNYPSWNIKMEGTSTEQTLKFLSKGSGSLSVPLNILTLDSDLITSYRNILLRDQIEWSDSDIKRKPINLSLLTNYKEVSGSTTTRYGVLQLADSVTNEGYDVLVKGIYTPDLSDTTYDNYAASKKYVDDKVSAVPEQVQSDWEDTSGMGEILHKPSFNGTVLEANDWDTALYDLPVITHDVSKVYSDYTSITGIIDSTPAWTNTGAHIEIPITPDLVGIEITGPSGYETTYAFLVEDQLQSGQTAPPTPITIAAGGTIRVSVPYGEDYIYIQTNNGTYHTRPTSIKLIMLNQEDSGYVHIAGSETITGQKTFTSDVVLWNGSQSSGDPTPYLEFRKATSSDNKNPDWKIRGDGLDSLSFYSSKGGTDTKQVEFSATGLVSITGASKSTSLQIQNGDVDVRRGSIIVYQDVTATTGNITATAGDIIATAGNITAGLDVTANRDITATHGSIAAGLDVTANRNITATTGNITATAGDIEATSGNITANIDITATTGSITAGRDVTATRNITAGKDITTTTGNITATAGDVIAGGNGRFKGLMFDRNSGTGTGHYIMSYQYHSLVDSTNGSTYRAEDTMPVTSKNVVNYVEDYVTTAIGNIPSPTTFYWANQTISDEVSYITTPEFKQVTINGSTTNAQSADHCVLVYDTTNKCLKFTF